MSRLPIRFQTAASGRLTGIRQVKRIRPLRPTLIMGWNPFSRPAARWPRRCERMRLGRGSLRAHLLSGVQTGLDVSREARTRGTRRCGLRSTSTRTNDVGGLARGQPADGLPVTEMVRGEGPPRLRKPTPAERQTELNERASRLGWNLGDGSGRGGPRSKSPCSGPITTRCSPNDSGRRCGRSPHGGLGRRWPHVPQCFEGG
jgi:hypothetical protein